ncbi:hypothetical protein MRB53_026176 [Persea americana]|uniref:Uncharacterized protein n=1 Tax=Persea americana TaxID=3435 RepID=A0ACC2LHU8_PERAE|nr:hypothetical protein MRB53_026176 [Persea americana]
MATRSSSAPSSFPACKISGDVRSRTELFQETVVRFDLPLLSFFFGQSKQCLYFCVSVTGTNLRSPPHLDQQPDGDTRENRSAIPENRGPPRINPILSLLPNQPFEIRSVGFLPITPNRSDTSLL